MGGAHPPRPRRAPEAVIPKCLYRTPKGPHFRLHGIDSKAEALEASIESL